VTRVELAGALIDIAAVTGNLSASELRTRAEMKAATAVAHSCFEGASSTRTALLSRFQTAGARLLAAFALSRLAGSLGVTTSECWTDLAACAQQFVQVAPNGTI